MQTNHNGKKVLFINLGNVVNVLYSIAVLNILKSLYPDLELNYLLDYESHGVLSNADFLNSLVVYNKHNLDLHNDSQILNKGSLRSIWNWIRKKRFDYIVDLSPTYKTSLVKFLQFRGEKINLKDDNTHLLYQNLDLLEQFDVANYQLDLTLPTYNLETEYVDRIFRRLIPDSSKPLIGLIADTKEEKDWANTKYSQLASRINQDINQTILLGTKRLKERNEQIASNIKGDSIDITSKLNIKRLELVIAKLDLIITSNPVAIYLAMAQQTPVLALATGNQFFKVAPLKIPNITLKGSDAKISNLKVDTVLTNITRLL